MRVEAHGHGHKRRAIGPRRARSQCGNRLIAFASRHWPLCGRGGNTGCPCPVYINTPHARFLRRTQFRSLSPAAPFAFLQLLISPATQPSLATCRRVIGEHVPQAYKQRLPTLSTASPRHLTRPPYSLPLHHLNPAYSTQLYRIPTPIHLPLPPCSPSSSSQLPRWSALSSRTTVSDPAILV